MRVTVVFLESAERDLLDLRHYVLANLSAATWNTTLRRLKNSVRKLKSHPRSGAIPDELRAMNTSQYRQIVSGMNRIIYELRDDTAYIHLVCDTRRDMKSLLTRRILTGS